MPISAYLLAWNSILSQPKLVKSSIIFINIPLAEKLERAYQVKYQFNILESDNLDNIYETKIYDNFSQLNSIDEGSKNKFLGLNHKLNYINKKQKQEKKIDNKSFVNNDNDTLLEQSSISSLSLPKNYGLLPREINLPCIRIAISPCKSYVANLQEKDITAEDDPLVIPTKPQEVKIDNLTPLTLEKAIEIAAANNRGFKIAKLQLEQAKSDLNEQKAAWFPSLALQSNLNRVQDAGQEVRLKESGLENFASTNITNNVGVQFNLLSPQRQAQIKNARETVRISELQVKNVEQELRLDVAQAYYNLQQSDEEVAIAEKDVKARQQQVEIVKKLLDAALATRLELLNAEVELDNAIQGLRTTKARQLTNRRAIAQILSLPANVTPTAADPVEIKEPWNLSLEETIILAFQNRVELEQQLAQRRSGEAQRQLAWAGIKPQLSLFANYDFVQLYSDQPGDNIPRGFGDGYTLGVNFNWTFWDGGLALARAKRAKATIAIAEQNYANTANQIRLEVEQAYLQLQPNLENVETATEAVTRAEAAVDAAIIRFRANLDTQTEVLNAQARLVQAENNLVSAILDYDRALVALQRAVGTTKIDKNPTLHE